MPVALLKRKILFFLNYLHNFSFDIILKIVLAKHTLITSNGFIKILNKI